MFRETDTIYLSMYVAVARVCDVFVTLVLINSRRFHSQYFNPFGTKILTFIYSEEKCYICLPISVNN